jgi:hypothetical protein
MKVISRKFTKNITPRPRRLSSGSSSVVEVVGAQSMEALWRGFHAESYGADTPPKGSICVRDYARLNQVTKICAAGFLSRMEQAGKLQSAMFRVRIAEGNRMVRYYWTAKKKAN